MLNALARIFIIHGSKTKKFHSQIFLYFLSVFGILFIHSTLGRFFGLAGAMEGVLILNLVLHVVQMMLNLQKTAKIQNNNNKRESSPYAIRILLERQTEQTHPMSTNLW